MTASVQLSNGTSQVTSAGTWDSDNVAVASVNGNGLVTGNSSGDVTIFFDATGNGRATKRFTVMPDFGSNRWIGTYLITSCTQSGSFAVTNFCAGLVEKTRDFAFGVLTQVGLTVSGSWSVQRPTGQALARFAETSGTIRGNSVALSSHSTNTPGIVIAMTWQLVQPSVHTLTGTNIQTWTKTGASGKAVLAGTIWMVDVASAATGASRQ